MFLLLGAAPVSGPRCQAGVLPKWNKQRTGRDMARADGPACWACRPTDVPEAPRFGAQSLPRASNHVYTYIPQLGGGWRPP